MTKLRLVDDEYKSKPLAYVVGTDMPQLTADLDEIRSAGEYVIINDGGCLVDDIPLRTHLACLSIADVLVLPSTWWTSVVAHQLVNIAGWVGITLAKPSGEKIETVGIGGKRR